MVFKWGKAGTGAVLLQNRSRINDWDHETVATYQNYQEIMNQNVDTKNLTTYHTLVTLQLLKNIWYAFPHTRHFGIKGLSIKDALHYKVPRRWQYIINQEQLKNVLNLESWLFFLPKIFVSLTLEKKSFGREVFCDEMKDW